MQILRQAQRAMAAMPRTVDEARRTVEVVWTTGAAVERYIAGEPVSEVLVVTPEAVRMGRLTGGGAPVLTDHYPSIGTQVGVVESARLEGGQGYATLRLGATPEADRVWQLVRDGIVRNVSVGYDIHAYETTMTGGLPTDASGAKVLRVTDWEPYEISFVALPADAGAMTRGKESTMEEKKPEVAAPAVVETTEPQVVAPAETRAAPKGSTAEETVAAERAMWEEMIAAERARVQGILEVSSALHHPEFAVRAIADGLTVDAARLSILETIARQQMTTEKVGASGVEVGEVHEEKQRAAKVSELLARTGMLDLVKRAEKNSNLPSRSKEKLATVEAGHAFRGMSLFDIARESVRASGVKVEGMSRFEIGRLAMRSGYAATTDFPVLLEDVARKSLLAAYATQPDTWRRWVAPMSVSSWRSENRYRSGAFGDILQDVAEGAVYPQAAIPDGSKVSISPAKSGAMIGFTMEMLQNDDLGAFTALASAFGRAAGLKLENDAYALLTANSGAGVTMSDSHPFFYSARSNISTGAALSMAALDADRVHLATRQDPDAAEYLALTPSVLVIPVSLGGAARVLNMSTIDVTSGAVPGAPNRVAGLFSDIVESPRLSGTKRYIFPAIASNPAFVCVFHDEFGQAPELTTELGFDSDVTRMKIRLVAKMQAFDPRVALMNAGV